MRINLKPHHKFRMLAVSLPLTLLGASLLLVKNTNNKIASRTQLLEEISQKEQVYQESVSLNRFIKQNAIVLEQMSVALPNESMMVGVIKDMEAIIHRFDPAGKLKIASQTPIKSGQQLVIPLTITAQLTPISITQLIDELSKLPYILQILTIDIQFIDNNALVTSNLRMYVQEPFSGL